MIENLRDRRDDSWSVEEMYSQAQEVGLISDKKRDTSFFEKGKEWIISTNGDNFVGVGSCFFPVR